ncbi:MAG: glucokinase [Amphiplicatus sp.]
MADEALVADIGGTNARFALADLAGPAPRLSETRRFRAEDFATVEEAVAAYLKGVAAKPKAASFAVAAPVAGARMAFTNSSWVLDIERLGAALGLDDVVVINDFEALAYGVRHLEKTDLAPVKAGAAEAGAPVLVMGPGTGLGEALVAPAPGGPLVIATQGGHVAFAPSTDEEARIVSFLAREYGRVSAERVLSGPGIFNIYRALCAEANAPQVFKTPKEITDGATSDNMAARAVDMFCAMLGALVGDATLAAGARGGVVLGGGILPRIIDIFLASKFTERFLDKGRMRFYVERIPVDLITRDDAALVGAATRLREARAK